MAHEDAGHYAGKHAPDIKPDPKIAEAIMHKSLEGTITCAAAHRIARELEVSPAEVGKTIDLLEIRIKKCQLGLYGYSPQKSIVKPAENISHQLKEAIEKAVVNNRIACSACWKIADRLDIPKMDVSSTCETLKIKISPCQLGAF